MPPLLGMIASNSPAVSEVTVWFTESELVTVIVAPGLTLVGTWYAKFLMVIFTAVAAVEELLAEGIDVPDGVAALVVLVLGEALTDDVAVLVDWPLLPQAPRRKTLQVAAIAPAVSRAVIAVRPIIGGEFCREGFVTIGRSDWGHAGLADRPVCLGRASPVGGRPPKVRRGRKYFLVR